MSATLILWIPILLGMPLLWPILLGLRASASAMFRFSKSALLPIFIVFYLIISVGGIPTPWTADTWWVPGLYREFDFDDLKAGMSEAEVVAAWGEPLLKEATYGGPGFTLHYAMSQAAGDWLRVEFDAEGRMLKAYWVVKD